MNLSMRPPMQATALQQQHDYIHQRHHHLHNRTQQQQQPQQPQQPQQQLISNTRPLIATTTTTITTAAAAATIPATAKDPNQQQQQQQQHRKLNCSQKDILFFERNTSTTTKFSHRQSKNSDTNQQPPQPPQKQRQVYPQQHHHHHHHHHHHPQQQPQKQNRHSHPEVQGNTNRELFEDSIQLADLNNRPGDALPTAAVHRNFTAPHQSAYVPDQATSLIKPYSFSSSSNDKANSSYGEANDKVSLSTPEVSDVFDDPAEHFIINFPAADSPTHNRKDDNYDNGGVVLNPPLSRRRAESPTGGQRSLGDNKRAICLKKSNAALIFTRKELPQQQQQQEERKNSSYSPKTGNNKDFSVGQAPKRNSFCSVTLQSGDCSKNAGSSKPEKQHQHRRSLQLNYHNNLFGSVRGNSSNSSNNNSNFFFAPSKPHQNRVGNPTPSVSGKTAAATRRQHAYSWYAPVYSALEEELEQDSRDSSPVHNLANIKKLHSSHNQHRHSVQNASAIDSETDALLETRNQINIQAQLHLQTVPSIGRGKSQGGGGGGGGAYSRAKSSLQPPKSLPLPSSANALVNGNTALTSGSCDGGEGPQAGSGSGSGSGSLGLAGGPLPRIKRWEHFVKNFFIRPSSNGRVDSDAISSAIAANPAGDDRISSRPILHFPASPEIHITRTPSDQNVRVMHDPTGRSDAQAASEKLANGLIQGSSSSLNVVHQKLWNIMRREGSASSLYQEKSNSIVQYRGMRKCETVLALTRQTTSSVCSPVLGLGPGIIGGAASQQHMGSGVFSASGVERIRPLNRLRNSVSSMNATCSRCSSLLSLAASGSRYSLNIAANGGGAFVSIAPSANTQHYLQTPPIGRNRPQSQPQQQQQHQHQQPQFSSYVSSSSNLSSRSRSDVTDSKTGGPSNSSQCSRKSSAASSGTSPPSNVTTATFTSTMSTPNTPTKISDTTISDCTRKTTSSSIKAIDVTSLLSTSSSNSSSSSVAEVAAQEAKTAQCPNTISLLTFSKASSKVATKSDRYEAMLKREQEEPISQTTQLLLSSPTPEAAAAPAAPAAAPAAATVPVASLVMRPFEMFTCKLCLVDVEAAEEATTLMECGCQFCIECMKAYIEFEISEGAYEISCPDAQCPAQGVITLPEIANLTTTNLLRKHHRYRLNREIELDKSRTWCPRAGCETVCMVGPVTHNDASASTSIASTSHSAAALASAAASASASASAKENDESATTAITTVSSNALCAVRCPSCKDEFCSACKKAWHPNISCEENSRRLVADGQDDIGIPFDSDLIKCCPMCAVPIEKDEGCAQMMCKRCKHVFCWYCLASLDDDFLLRHYDKGPCKNKLGHSRASVVWHRAQVIGIFAGFGILLLVASPLLLLAAPCIICCKCRICSGSKADEGDGETDEAAAALQS